MSPDEFEKFKSSISGRSGESDWTVLDYKRDFERLWSEDPSLEGNIAIVWDSLPEGLDRDTLSLAEHLTPYDWALTFSSDLLSRAPQTKLRLAIVDAYSWKLPQSFGCRMADSLLAALPWVSIFRLLPRKNGLAVPDPQQPETFIKLVEASADPLPIGQQADARDVAEQMAALWRQDLCKRESRHDINNLIGPMLLLEGFGATAPCRLGRSTLLRHLRRLGLSASVAPKPGAWFDVVAAAASLGRKLRIVLVDDQANEGWIDVLCRALTISRFADEAGRPIEAERDQLRPVAGSSDVEIWSCTSPEPLLRQLSSRLASSEDTDFRFQLSFTDAPDDTEEVLLLDLRLVENVRSERDYFKDLIGIASELDRRAAGIPVWEPLIPENEGWPASVDEGLDEWLDRVGTRDSETYLKLLSLMPRLIASADLSLPILLFSSTGQRSVLQALEGYGTIISDFEKPRLMGYKLDDAGETARAQWARALQRAADILRARLAVTRIPRATTALEPRDIPATLYQGNSPVIDIFTDEQGDEWREEDITVGGLVVIHQDNQSAAAFYQDMRLPELIKDCPPVGCSRSDFRAWKKRLRKSPAKLVSTLDAVLTSHSSRCGIVELTGSYLLSGDPLDPEDMAAQGRRADDLYRAMLTSMIETAVFHLVPAVSGAARQGASFRLFLATRVRSIEQYEKFDNGYYKKDRRGNRIVDKRATELARQKADLDWVHWGIKSGKAREIVYYFPEDAARPIALAVAALYAAAPGAAKPVHARGYSINLHIEKTGAVGLHYLADALLDKEACKDTARWRSAGFSGRYDDQFRRHLNAARLASNGFIGRAVSVSSRAGLIPSSSSHVSSLLAGRVASAAMRMKGVDFVAAVDDMRQEEMLRHGRRSSDIATGKTPADSSKTTGFSESPGSPEGITCHGRIQRTPSDADSCMIESDGVWVRCPLPQLDGMWLFNGDEVEFVATRSMDEGSPTLNLLTVSRVTKRAPGLDRIETGAIVHGRRVTQCDDVATVSFGPVKGIWRWKALSDPEPRKNGIYDFIIEALDGRLQQAELRLASRDVTACVT